jgi:hypothetical protein
MMAVALSGPRGQYRSAASGVIVGLGTMIQPHFLFLAPGLLYVTDRKKYFLAALALTLLPLALRNSLMSGDLLPVYDPSVFKVGLHNFFGLQNNMAIVDRLYKNVAVIFTRGWDKQQRIDLNTVLYMAQYGYVLLMAAGLAGLARYIGRAHRRLLLPMLGYFLIVVLLSNFTLSRRVLMEPLFVIGAGLLLAEAGRFLLSRLRGEAASGESIAQGRACTD